MEHYHFRCLCSFWPAYKCATVLFWPLATVACQTLNYGQQTLRHSVNYQSSVLIAVVSSACPDDGDADDDATALIIPIRKMATRRRCLWP